MIATVIIVIIIAIAFVAALRQILKNHKKGGCGCGCEGCSRSCRERSISKQ